MNDKIINVADYYSKKLKEHGATAKGVDWNGEESQLTRFLQITRLFRQGKNLQGAGISDLGCGYGAFFDYLEVNGYSDFDYHGYDVSKDMCDAAAKRIGERANVYLNVSESILHPRDFSVASGIFSVKLAESDAEWERYIYSVLDDINSVSNKGFAFNCLTSYSDHEKKRDHLYYANPLEVFDYCKRNFSRNVALLHDYDLYEFTILVKTV